MEKLVEAAKKNNIFYFHYPDIGRLKFTHSKEATATEMEEARKAAAESTGALKPGVRKRYYPMKPVEKTPSEIAAERLNAFYDELHAFCTNKERLEKAVLPPNAFKNYNAGPRDITILFSQTHKKDIQKLVDALKNAGVAGEEI